MNEKEKFQKHLTSFVNIINNSYHQLYFDFLGKTMNVAQELQLDIKIESYYKVHFLQKGTNDKVNVYAVNELLEQAKSVNITVVPTSLLQDIVFIQYANSNESMKEYLRVAGLSFKNERRFVNEFTHIHLDNLREDLVAFLGVDNCTRYEKFMIEGRIAGSEKSKPTLKL